MMLCLRLSSTVVCVSFVLVLFILSANQSITVAAFPTNDEAPATNRDALPFRLHVTDADSAVRLPHGESLVVSEVAKDNGRYGVTPPASLVAGAKTLQPARGYTPQRIRDRKLYYLWERKVEWWQTSFPLPPSDEIDIRVKGWWYTNCQNYTPKPDRGVDASVDQLLSPLVQYPPYLMPMLTVSKNELYNMYLELLPKYHDNNAYFFDAADCFFELGMRDLGLRVLSNIAEIQQESMQVLRMLAYRLIQAGELTQALNILDQARELAPEKPQLLWDIATVKASLGDTQASVNLLHEIAVHSWDSMSSFPQTINMLALTERNALLATSGVAIKAESLDPDLSDNLSSDIRVVITWDVVGADIKLQVHEPDGNMAPGFRKPSRLGGQIESSEFGITEYMLKKAVPGVYRIEVVYCPAHNPIPGKATLLAVIYRNFGTPLQTEEKIMLRLNNQLNRVLVKEFTVE